MFVVNTKNIVIGISLALLLSSCSTSQREVSPKYNHDAVATDATKSEIQSEIKYEQHLRKIKRYRQLRLKLKKKKENLGKFCFKDARSIHYRAEERCK